MEKSRNNQQEPLSVPMTLEQWETVLRCLKYCADYHDAKKWEWLASLNNQKIAQQKAAEHENQKITITAIHKIVESMVYQLPEAE